MKTKPDTFLLKLRAYHHLWAFNSDDRVLGQVKRPA
jgi:hypothetical protein